MVDRQPVGCFCLFRRGQKNGKAKGDGGAAVAAEAAQRLTAAPGQNAAAPPANREPQHSLQVCVSAAAVDGVPTPPEPGPISPVAPGRSLRATDVELLSAAAVPAMPATHTPASAASTAAPPTPALTAGAPPPQAADSLLEPAPSLRGLEATRSLSTAAAAAAAAATAAAHPAFTADAAAAADTAPAANVTDAAAVGKADAVGTDPESHTVAATVEAGGSAATAPGAVAASPDNPKASTSTADDTAVAGLAATAPPGAGATFTGAVHAAAAAACEAAAADAGTAPEEEEEEEPRAQSTASRCSTEFYSAGGWSQFGEDGEWLGGPAAALSLFHSVDVPDAVAATVAAAAATATASAAKGPNRPQLDSEPLLGQNASSSEARSHVQERKPQQQETQQQETQQQQPHEAHQRQEQRGHPARPGGEEGPAQPAGFPTGSRPPAAAAAASAEGSGLAPRPSPPPLPGSAPHAPLPQPAASGDSIPSTQPLVAAMQEPTETPKGTERCLVLAGGSGHHDQQQQQQQQQGEQAPPSPPRQEHQEPHQQQQQQQQLGESASSCPGGHGAVGAGAYGSSAGASLGASSRDAVLDQVADLYGMQGRPCKACQALLQFCKASGVEPESVAGDLRARGLPDAAVLTRVVQGVSRCLADLATDEGWHMVRNDELQLLYRNPPGSSVHAFRARCTLDHPVEQPLALAREVDLCPSWNKYCTTGSVLREMSVTDVLVYIALWMPWPFHNVGFMLEANGADLYEEEGRLLVCFQSPDTKPAQGPEASPPLPLPPPPAAAAAAFPPGSEKHTKVRLLAPSCISFRPLLPKSPGGGPPRTRCEVQCYVDPGLRHVPPFIISFVLRVLSPFMYAAVKKVLASAFKNPTNPLPKRIQQRPELYDLVRRRTEAFLRPRAADGKEAAAGAAAAGRTD